MTERENFEAWMTSEQWFHGSDFNWDGPRNCYAEFGIHLAYKAWQAAKVSTQEQMAALAAEWIEGSEPAEFGRYWVRYNTDVGPQYCSAKWMRHNFCAGSDTNIHNIWLADHSRSINPLRGVTHYTKLPDPLELAQQLRDEVKS